MTWLNQSINYYFAYYKLSFSQYHTKIEHEHLREINKELFVTQMNAMVQAVERGERGATYQELKAGTTGGQEEKDGEEKNNSTTNGREGAADDVSTTGT